MELMSILWVGNVWQLNGAGGSCCVTCFAGKLIPTQDLNNDAKKDSCLGFIPTQVNIVLTFYNDNDDDGPLALAVKQSINRDAKSISHKL